MATCSTPGKARFDSPAEAMTSVKGDKNFEPYKCRCRKWHLRFLLNHHRAPFKRGMRIYYSKTTRWKA